MATHILSRRKFLRLATLSTGGALLAACSQPSQAPVESTQAPLAEPTLTTQPSAAEVVKLVYWHGWSVEFEKKAIFDGVALFNQTHPKIQVEAVDSKTSDALLPAIAGGNPPDIGISWTVYEAAQWRATDVIQDLDALARANNIDDSKFVTASIEACKFKGETYFGLPIQMDATAVYYNKTIFKDAGLDPEKDLPTTFEDMFDLGAKLTKFDSAGNLSQLGLTSCCQYLREGSAYQFGGRWWDPSTKLPTANDPANVSAWQSLGEYYKAVDATKIATFNGQKAENPLGSLFIAGKVAMTYDGDWVINYLAHYAPDLDYGIFLPPPAKGKEGTQYNTPIDQCIYLIPTGVKHSAESWEFIKWMATSEDVCGLIVKVMANSSALRSANQSKYWVSDRFKFFSDLISQDKLMSWPPIAVANFYFIECSSAADRLYFGQETSQQTLDELQKKVTDELSKSTT